MRWRTLTSQDDKDFIRVYPFGELTLPDPELDNDHTCRGSQRGRGRGSLGRGRTTGHHHDYRGHELDCEGPGRPTGSRHRSGIRDEAGL